MVEGRRDVDDVFWFEGEDPAAHHGTRVEDPLVQNDCCLGESGRTRGVDVREEVIDMGSWDFGKVFVALVGQLFIKGTEAIGFVVASLSLDEDVILGEGFKPRHHEFDLFAVFLARQDRDGLRDLDRVHQGGARDVGVDQRRRGPQAIERRDGEEEFRAIVHQERDDIALLDSQFLEGARRAIHLAIDFAPGEALLFEADRGVLPILTGPFFEQSSDVPGCAGTDARGVPNHA